MNISRAPLLLGMVATLFFHGSLRQPAFSAVAAEPVAGDPAPGSETPPAQIRIKVRQKLKVGGPDVSPDGKLAVKAGGLTAQLYEVDTGNPFGPPLKHHQRRRDTQITTWAFSADGRWVAVGTGDPSGKRAGDSAGEVRVWEVGTGQLVVAVTDTHGVGYVNRLAFSPDGQTVLVDCDDISGK